MLRRTLIPTVLAALVTTAACGDSDAPMPSQDTLIVSSVYEDVLHVLDPATGRVLRELAVDPRETARDAPSDVAVGHRGTNWFTVLGQAPAELWEFFGTERIPTRRLRLPGFRNAARIAVSPDDRWAVVSEYHLGEVQQPGHLAVIDLDRGAVGRMSPCVTPYGIAFSANGRAAAISCPVADEVVVVRGDDFEVEARFTTTTPDQSAPTPGNPVSRPMGLAWSPAGDRIYVALYDRGSVASFTPAGEFIREVPVDGRPVGLEVTGRGRYVVAAVREPGSLVVIDTRTGDAEAMPLAEAIAPHDLVLSPDGTVAFVAWEGGPSTPGGVTAVDLDAGEILWTRETGPMTTGIAYRFDPTTR